jgi:hypothetical protein
MQPDISLKIRKLQRFNNNPLKKTVFVETFFTKMKLDIL